MFLPRRARQLVDKALSSDEATLFLPPSMQADQVDESYLSQSQVIAPLSCFCETTGCWATANGRFLFRANRARS